MAVKSQNITKVEHRVTDEQRWARNRHKGAVVWLTGLSASGKSTLATLLEKQLFAWGYQVYVLDGDNMRRGVCSDLGFSPKDRQENIRRIGELAALLAHSGSVVISAFISPYQQGRQQARMATEAVGGGGFHEIYLQADLAVCENRDPKGLYAKARCGEISDFTGISAPYEAPLNANLVIDTGALTVGESLEVLAHYVERQVAR